MAAWLALSPWLSHLHPETLSPTGQTLTLPACRRSTRVRGRCGTTWRGPLSGSLLTGGRARKATSPTGAVYRTRRSVRGCPVRSGRRRGWCSASSTPPKRRCGRGRLRRRLTEGPSVVATTSRRWRVNGGRGCCCFAFVSMPEDAGRTRKVGVRGERVPIG